MNYFCIYSGDSRASWDGPYPYHLTSYFVCRPVPMSPMFLSTTNSCSGEVPFDQTSASMGFRFKVIRWRVDYWDWLFPVHASRGQLILSVVFSVHRFSVPFLVLL